MKNNNSILKNLDTSEIEKLLILARERGLSQKQNENSRITRVTRDAPLTLSFAQQRLWFLAQLDGVSDTYHIPFALRLTGPLDVSAWRQSLDHLFERHDALRTVFGSNDGQPYAELLLAGSGMPLALHDLRHAGPQTLAQLCHDEAHAPFDLSRGPLIRTQLLQTGEQEHLFLLTQHHIVSDGWSMGVLLNELSALYTAFSQQQSDPLPALPIQYPDYAAWQRQWLSGERLSAQTSYWRHALANAPILLALPTDRPRPPQQSFAGAEVPLQIDAALTQALKRLSQRHGVTLFMTVLAAWAAVLSRLSGQDDLVIGTPTANRNRTELEPLVGFFVNTLALRIDLTGEPDTASMLSRVRQNVLAAQDHQDLPFEQVVEIVQPPRQLDHTPLFQVMFAWQNNDEGSLALPGLQACATEPPFDTAKFDLELTLGEVDGLISGALGYATALFDAPTIERHCGYLLAMLRAMAASNELPVARIPLLGQAERTLLLDTWNQTQADFPDHLCIHHLFEQQVLRSPEAIAVIHDDLSLTYAQLNIQANRLAHRLIELGVRPDDRVALCLERSPSMIVGLLAVLKAGAAYVPLDPVYPGERLRHILTDAQPVLLLADHTGLRALGDVAALPVIHIDQPLHTGLPDSNPQPPHLTSLNLAYVIYTSGSTGNPKGVMVEHRSVMNLHRALRQHLWANCPDDAIVALNISIAFDASLQGLLALFSGYTAVVVPQRLRSDGPALVEFLETERVDIFDCTPAQLEMLLSSNLTSRRTNRMTLSVGGEVIRPSTWALLAGLPGISAYSVYGPTEYTVDATIAAISPAHPRPNIGRPIANTRLYVLDGYGQPAPLGVAGELYIGGAGVARGYLNRPDLTAARFLNDPFSPNPLARMYRTGDLVRYMPDGNLEFLGRNDQQVKIRGFRIEPGEIEARLAEHPLVQEAAVIAREDSPGEKRLVAYVVSPAAQPDELAPALRAHLSDLLPEYMVPSAFVRLANLPLTPNGKLDRRALPAPDADAFARQAYEPPQGSTETILASIWAELLGLEQISRNDNFFELGGHSLLAVRLASRVQQACGTALPLATLFASPTVARLAHAITGSAGQALPAIAHVTRDAPLTLSFAQQRLWFLAQLDGVSDTYHIPFALRLTGPLDVSAWRQSLDHLFERHDALRTVFGSNDGQPYAELLLAGSGMPLALHDLRHAGPQTLAQLCHDEAHAPFDLSRGPLIRTQLLQTGEQEHLFLLTQHHIVSDGWSMGVLLNELSALYTAFSQQQSDPLPALPIQYPDYAAWQRQWLSGERLSAQTSYWRHALANAPILLALPTDRPRPPQQSFAGAEVPLQIDAALTQALKRLSQRHGVTLFMTVLAAWAAVLSRLSGQDDLVIGTPTANRNRTELEPLVGFFVNTLALRIDLTGEPDTASMLSRVRQNVLAAQDHQDLPFEQVVEIVQPPRQLDHTPLFQVMFAWQNNDEGSLALPGLQACATEPPFDTAKFDLELTLGEVDGLISGALGYATALFDAPTIERHCGYLLAMLRAMAASNELPVARIPLLGQAERTLLLDTWNQTQADFPDHLCIHHLFEQQVLRSPEAIAVIHDDLSLTYAQLNIQANRLAHRLIELGVRPGRCVVTLIDRSVTLVIAQLAILKSGGMYVPIDSKAPASRQTWTIRDCDPCLVLADQSTGSLPSDIPALTLPSKLFDSGPDFNPDPTLKSDDAAYVMYTSGSTGAPKGVVVPHRAVSRLVINSGYIHFDASDRMAFAANPSFDASTFEVWTPLLNGGVLVVVNQTTLLAPQSFVRTLQVTQVNTMWLTAGLFNQIISELGTVLPQLKNLVVGGDRLDPSAIAQVLRNSPPQHLLNGYGPTESTTFAATYEITALDAGSSGIPIGRPIANTRLYVLDGYGQPAPLGVAGELYIGGAGVARGYLNRPDLTAARFLNDPFSPNPLARMYRTGDLVRYMPDGNLEFLGRNDQQVKIRGFRIEPGEIEARLAEHPLVQEAAVIAREDSPGEKRLVAYVVSPAAQPDELAPALRAHLSDLLPEYMVPSAFVRLANLPLTPNGKLDRRALPAPDADAFARQAYEPPQGSTETILASIWAELLGLEQISRNDNFFELGGHSLLAVRLMEKLRRLGMSTTVRALFETPNLASLAATLGQYREVSIPPNIIHAGSSTITPLMLPMIDLTQQEINHIVAHVPHGTANIQDIYALSPLQEGILFHHLLAPESDPYVLVSQISFTDRRLLDRYLEAVQQVVDRHDILRTAFVWENLSEAAQVVWRNAPMTVTEIGFNLNDGTAAEQLGRYFEQRHRRLDLTRAPLMQFFIIQEPLGKWHLLQGQHHLIGDHSTMEVMHLEMRAIFAGDNEKLDDPQPFRNLVAQARFGVSQQEHECFFRDMLSDIDEPCAPFGLAEIYNDGVSVKEKHILLPRSLSDRLRLHARRLGVSLASLFHLAWAQVIARTSGREHVVFGTVLVGRMQAGEGADRAMGLFINTLPLRLDLDATGVETSVRHAHERLAKLLTHEHASLALAQRCSGVAAPAPLFSALLNYRHNSIAAPDNEPVFSGIEFLGGDERTNYPFGMCVDDFGLELGLTAQVVSPHSSERVCGYMHEALNSLANALENAPHSPVRNLEVLPIAERTLLLDTWNQTQADFPDHLCIHHLFEQQVLRSPEAIAVIHDDLSLTYAQLNIQANRLAHRLIELGVRPDDRVALCLERSPSMIVGLLAVLKAGAAYVPLDPVYPGERLRHILTDAQPVLLLADHTGLRALGDVAALPVIHIDQPLHTGLPDSNPQPPHLTSLNLAYVIYTSGSTGNPKGVMVSHYGLSNLAWAQTASFTIQANSRVLQFASVSFDASVSEISTALVSGARLYLPSDKLRQDPDALWHYMKRHAITHVTLPPALLRGVRNLLALSQPLSLILAGEAPDTALLRHWRAQGAIFNAYGPTEGTVCASIWKCPDDFSENIVPIGRPIGNTRIYLLDGYGKPVPLGASGELYIGGAGVARGYLNRPELTAERFLTDPFAENPEARMYRTGDIARYLPDGNLEFLGRNDDQIKIRGFRIEPGEIAARLMEHPAVHEAVVDVRGGNSDKRLVGYVVAEIAEDIAGTLRRYLSQSLPDYMVPAAFVRIDAVPLSVNGKLDRRALPAPNADAFAHEAYEAPQGAIETTLAAIWRELLGLERVSRNDSFFALGGHSLLAVRLNLRIQQVMKIELPLTTIYGHPTFQDFAARVAGVAGATSAPNLASDTTLPPHIRVNDHLASITTGGIFLTGATGFVGAHLLNSLLHNTDAQIVCHVRAADRLAARDRLQQSLKKQKLFEAWDDSRIEIVLGNLAAPHLGLDEDSIRRVQDGCHAIYHCGAQVDFLHSYATLKAANVDSVVTLLDWTARGARKHFHFISTLSIIDPSYIGTEITEDSAINTWQGLVGGYNQSKWVADTLVRRAKDIGLPVSIYRLGSVTGDHVHGICNETDMIWRFVAACAAIQATPDIPLSLKMTPVDDVTRGIVRLSSDPRSSGQTYHMLSNQSVTLNDMISAFDRLGQPLPRIAPDAWIQRMRDRLAEQHDDRLAVVVAMLSREASPGGEMQISFDFTAEHLEAVEAKIRVITPGLLERYLLSLTSDGVHGE